MPFRIRFTARRSEDFGGFRHGGCARAYGTSLAPAYNPPPLARLDCRCRRPAKVVTPISTIAVEYHSLRDYGKIWEQVIKSQGKIWVQVIKSQGKIWEQVIKSQGKIWLA